MSLTGTLIVTEGDKGGIGKSSVSGLIAAAAEDQALKICFVDSDTGNSSTAQVQPDTCFVDLTDHDAAKVLLLVLAEINNGTFHCAIWDSGAREEKRVHEILEEIKSVAIRFGIPIVIFRPITTNHFVQSNAIDCVNFAKKNGFGVVYATILAQGRREKDMSDWRASKGRVKAVEYAVEIDIVSMGAIIGDNASSFFMSFTDVGLGRFDRVPEQLREKAKQKFDLGQQMFMAGYLERMTGRISSAVADAKKRINSSSERKKTTA